MKPVQNTSLSDIFIVFILVLTERHMQRIGHLLQSSMFLNYMWQKMRVAGAPVRYVFFKHNKGLLESRVLVCVSVLFKLDLTITQRLWLCFHLTGIWRKKILFATELHSQD